MSGFENPQEMGRPITIKDEGVTLTPNLGTIDFVGGGVTGTGLGDNITETIPIGAGLGDPVTILHGGTGSTTAEFSSTLNLTPLDYYVDNAGSDSNNGLTLATAFLTPEKALNSIPQMNGRVHRIFLTPGQTFTLTGEYVTNVYQGMTGDSDTKSLVQIIGDITWANPAIIKATTDTTNCFRCRGSDTKFQFDGISFQDCGSAVVSDGGFVEMIAFEVLRHKSTGLITQNGGRLVLATSSLGGNFTNSGAASCIGNGTGIGNITINRSLAFTLLSTGGALNIGNGSIALEASSTYTTTGNATSRAAYTVSGGTLALRGTNTFTDILAFSSAGDAAIRVLNQGNVSITAGSTITFNNCESGWQLDSSAHVSEGNAVTYNYNTVTRWVVATHGSKVSSTNFLGAQGHIVYVEDVFVGPIFGDDDRYVMTRRPTDLRRDVGDANATIASTDSSVVHSALSAPRVDTLPTVANATVDMTAGQERIFEVGDESGSCSVANSITVQVSGGATIDGLATFVINLPYGRQKFYCVVGGTNYFTK